MAPCLNQGILHVYDIPALVEEPALLEPLRRSVELGQAPAFLRSVKLKVTARCNLRCLMCRYGRGKSLPELDTTTWLRILDELAALGCRKVHLSGGEVLVRPDFETIVARAAAARMKVTLTSNLTLLTKERAKALFAHKVRWVSTSLDSAAARLHDEIRGVRGSYKRTLRGLSLIRLQRHAQRTRLRVNFVMMRQNFREYPELVRLASQHGAHDVVPIPVDTKRPRLRLSKRLIREYNEQIAPAVHAARKEAAMPLDERYIFPFGRGRHGVSESARGQYAAGYYRDHPCYAPFLHLFVAWDGSVYPCCMTNGRIEPLGDLSGQSVAEVFRGERFQRLRSILLRERLATCHACDLFLEENRALAAAIQPHAR